MSKTNKNNTNSKLIPELRFPEFKDKPQWEVKELGEVMDYEQPSPYLIESTAYSVSGTPVLTANKSFILGYTEETTGIYDNIPAIIFDDFTTDSKFVNFPFKIKSSAIKILKAKKNNNLSFLFYTLSKISYQAREHQRHYISQFQPMNIPFPSLAEQERIGALFSTLDSLIQAQSKEVQLLRLRKKGLMQKLFPYEGETTPEWRFPEFKDAPEWEEVSFIDCIKLYRGSSPRPIKNYITKDKDGVNWIKIGDATNCENKIINNVSEKITREGALRSRKVTKGELILANSMSYGNVYELGIDGYIYDGWFVLREYEEHYNRDFLRFMLNSDFIQKQYRQTSAGGVVLNISSDIVYNTQLYLTSKAEQKRIASVFSTLDALIEAKSQRLEQLKKHKKGLMQKMFP